MLEMSWRIVIILCVLLIIIFKGAPGCNEESSVM